MSDEPTRNPVIEGYSGLTLVGSGGFSRVYRAQQQKYSRIVAVKVVSFPLSSPADQRRFRREVAIMGGLSHHPNMVTIFDSGLTAAGQPYIVMDYLEQGSIADRLDSAGPLPLAEVLRFGIKIAGALATAHQLSIVHRDVKPANVLISRYGEPALADFGVAAQIDHLTLTAGSITPSHAAPEVVNGEKATAASDIYSFGSTLYAMLAGHNAFRAPTLMALIKQVLEAPPPPMQIAIPDTIVALVVSMMAKAPDDRPSGADGVGRALQAIETSLGFVPTALPFEAPSPRSEHGSVASQRVSAIDPDASIGGGAEDRPDTAPRSPNEQAGPNAVHSGVADDPTATRVHRHRQVARRHRSRPAIIAVISIGLLCGLGIASAALANRSSSSQPPPTTTPGSGGAQSTPPIARSHSAQDIIIRIDDGGGLQAPTSRGDVPSVLVYGDGTVLAQDRTQSGHISTFTIRHATDDQIETVLTAALQLEDTPEDLGTLQVTDMGTTNVKVSVAQRTIQRSAYGLGFDGADSVGLLPEQRLGRATLKNVVEMSSSLGVPGQVWVPPSIEIRTTSVGPFSGQKPLNLPLAWVEVEQRGCTVVTSDDANALLAAFGNNSMPTWTLGNATFQVTLRPVLPGLTACS